jgi:hypothetical protein
MNQSGYKWTIKSYMGSSYPRKFAQVRAAICQLLLRHRVEKGLTVDLVWEHHNLQLTILNNSQFLNKVFFITSFFLWWRATKSFRPGKKLWEAMWYKVAVQSQNTLKLKRNWVRAPSEMSTLPPQKMRHSLFSPELIYLFVKGIKAARNINRKK